MMKQDLIKYLDAICDAESVNQACRDAIEQLNVTVRRLSSETIMPEKPREYVAASVSAPLDEETVLWGAGAVFVVAWIIMGISASIFVTIIAVIAMICYNRKSIAEQRASAEALAVQRNIAEKNRYDEQMGIYHQHESIRMRMLAIANQEIEKHNAIMTSTQAKLDRLYGQGVLHPNFHTSIAAHQIRDYLQMGVCDILEGATGAYAQYMLDVRTEKVCTSISDMKKALAFSIRSLQSTLMGELRQIDSNISDLGLSFTEAITSLDDSVKRWRSVSDGHYEEARRYMQLADKRLASMEYNIAASSHNQYIQQRLQNVDAYLLRIPHGR